MIPRVALVTGLILVVSVLSFAAPNVNSQEFTTSTSFLTSSTTQTLVSTNLYNVTSTTTGTMITTFQLSKVQSCYESVLSFYSTGNVTFSYSASGSMTIYLIDEAIVELAAMRGVFVAPLFYAVRCDRANLLVLANTTAQSEFMRVKTIISILGNALNQPVTGSFGGDFDRLQNPWSLVVIAPMSNPNSTLTLTYGPVVNASRTAETVSSTITSTLVNTITMSFSTVLEVPTPQTYSGWLVGGIPVAMVVVMLFLACKSKRHGVRKTRRKQSTPRK